MTVLVRTGGVSVTTALGRVLQRFAGVDFVAVTDLAGKFRRSVGGRRGTRPPARRAAAVSREGGRS